jgi:hypothetical protein
LSFVVLTTKVEIEENGGDTQCVEISALKNVNIDALEEAIVTAAELEGLWLDPNGPAEVSFVSQSFAHTCPLQSDCCPTEVSLASQCFAHT